MPNGNMLKYFGERGGPNSEHGKPLFWPGTVDGFPFRGATAPNLHETEYQAIQHTLDYNSCMFCLWEPDQKAEFDRIMDRIVNGWYMQHKRSDRWVEEHSHFAVWLEWVQIYGESPHSKHPGGPIDHAAPIIL